MDLLFDTPIFGVFISIFAYILSTNIKKKIDIPLLNPLILSIAMIITFLLFLDIDYSKYEKGGDIVGFFLGPATILLAVPLYKQLKNLEKNLAFVIIGVFVGSISAILSVIVLNKFFNISDPVAVSLVPKSVTAAISKDISAQIGGIPSITIAATVLTGIIGNILGVHIFKFLKIKDPIAQGISLGTGSHAIGTSKALELGEIQGGFSSIAISIAGLITSIAAPYIVKLLK